MWQHITYLCVRCFQCREVCGLAIASPHTSLHWKQYMICCHITHNNGILIILIRDFSWELYVLPDDDMRCAIETCRSSEKCFSVNNFRLIYDIQLVHLLVCNTHPSLRVQTRPKPSDF